ncbi:RNA-binding protein CP29B, chloroplastic-like, partial [Telopea speciosissima]|uniref:RNA-binding protein CP29B, chloroplastic-like n=1 Tax=Telopea speciosissima TaxID=54955 RepID=UPI001CC7CFBF
SPQTLSFSKTQNPSVNLFSTVTLTSSAKCNNRATTISFSSPSKTRRCVSLSSSHFTPKVAISSEFEQGEWTFSPNLKLLVGNLSFNVDSSELAGLCGRAGNVEMVEVIYDKMTGRSRDFGFVTMSILKKVDAAAMQFNGYEIQGRSVIGE